MMPSNNNRVHNRNNSVTEQQGLNNPNQSNNQSQQIIEQYTQLSIRIAIINREYIDESKLVKNTRLLILNLSGIRPTNEEKINMLAHSCKEKQIDGVIISQVNTKQIS